MQTETTSVRSHARAEPFVALMTDIFVIRDGKIAAQTFVMLA